MTRPLVALLLLVVVFAGCAQLMMGSIEALMKQGIELLTAGKYDAALELGDRSEVVPVLAEALFRAGADALGRGQFSEAVGHLLEYVQLKPTEGQGYLQLGRAYLGTGTYGNAPRTLVQGLALRLRR